ncbi:hypothetical protein GCM10022256_22280 [Frondihabitans peucedani]|uniref:Uncharacterized protein n=1 Tax=Frondihabitans peucedani TaxID=598626 RepID=A0ABP8E2Z1_9MICO
MDMAELPEARPDRGGTEYDEEPSGCYALGVCDERPAALRDATLVEGRRGDPFGL